MAPLAILLQLMRLSTAIAVTTNYISRSTEQQVIATVAPAVAAADADGQSAQPFLTSPSGSYAAYLHRAVGSSGGPGGDACYVQIQQANDGGSVWQSGCTPVSGADTCDLAFSPAGLELFAGGRSLWGTGIDGEPGALSLDDGGDMRIVSKDGATVWKASAGNPWTGQQCAAAVPSSPSPSDVLPLPAGTSAKLLTPPETTVAAPGSPGFSFGDQPAAAPVDALPPPAADASPDSPALPLPPPADVLPDTPDLPLPPPPADAYPVSPDQPLYSSPPPAPTMPPLDTPPLAQSPDTGGEASPGTPLPGVAAPLGMLHPHGSPHQLPVGASPAAVPDALAPSGHGAGAGLPFGQGGQQQGHGVFGQQQQLFNGAGQPLEDSSGGWSRGERGRLVALSLGLVGLMVLASGF